MKQEEKSIYDFVKGDIITRLKPIIYSDGEKDFSFVGKAITFLGIANASIYLSKETDFFTSLLTGKDKFTIQLPLEVCERGWGEYVKPDFLEDTDGPILDDEEIIQLQIKKAIKEDDFETADELKKKLDKIRKNRKK
jgi:hypothetical protein